MPNPAKTLREIAVLAEQMAGELELQHNRQNNEFQGVLGNVELGIDNQLKELRQEIAALRVGQEHSAERQRTILEMLETLQADVRALADGTRAP